MSKSSHQIFVKAVDQTGGAFSSISQKAAATGAKLRQMLGGALAAAGAYLGFRQVLGAINNLGQLSDVAQKTNTNVAELTRTARAFQVLGINMNTEGIAKAFQMMAKNTGRTGLRGFYDTIAEIGKIPDIAGRSEAAMKAFGRSGLELMPLINAADQGAEALQRVVAAMPGVSDAAANAGDEISDSMSIVSGAFQEIWYGAIGRVCRWFSNDYTSSVRTAAAKAAGYLVYYSKLAWEKSQVWLYKFSHYFTDAWFTATEFFSSEGDVGKRWDNAKERWAGLSEGREIDFERKDEAFEEIMADLDSALSKRLEAAEKLDDAYAAAATGFNSAAESLTGASEDAAESAAKAKRQLRNELMMGGSNAAVKMSILGPQLESEQKKTNRLLEKIAKNTAKKEVEPLPMGIIGDY